MTGAQPGPVSCLALEQPIDMFVEVIRVVRQANVRVFANFLAPDPFAAIEYSLTELPLLRTRSFMASIFDDALDVPAKLIPE